MFHQYIHNFRGLAILFIVASHCAVGLDWNRNLALQKFFHFIFFDGTVFFVFISGFLFQTLSVKYEMKSYFVKKVKNIIFPYLIVSIPAIILFTFYLNRHTLPETFYDQSVLYRVLFFIFSGEHLAPLWFIPMIVCFFIISPFLIAADKFKYFYHLLPLFVLISIFFPRNTHSIPQSFVHFFSVYVFGMFFSRYKERILPISKKHIIVLSLLFIITFFLYWSPLSSTSHAEYNLVYISKMILTAIITSYLYSNKLYFEGAFGYLGNISFGIYFIHMYFISGARFFSSGVQASSTSIEGNIITYPVFFFIIIILCSISIWSFQKLFGKKSRYLIGC